MHNVVLRAMGIAILLVGMVSHVAPAQDLTNNQKAVIAFDLRVDKLMDNPLMQSPQVQAIAGASTPLPPGVAVDEVKRVFGAVSLPDDVSQFETMWQSSSLPIEFFVRVEFDNGSGADEMMQGMRDDSETLIKDGVTYFRPPENKPDNLLAHRIDQTTVEFGTNNYLFRADRKVFSDGLQTAWNKVPDHALRIAIDLEGRRDLVNQALELAKAESPPMMGGFFDLINKAGDLRLSFDLNDKNVIVLSATGLNESEAEALRGGLDAIMGIAKMSGQQTLPMLAEQDPDSAKVVGAVLESLNAKRDGLDIHVAVPKPDGFDKAILALMEQTQKAASEVNEMNRIRQHLLSVHNYHDVYKRFPTEDEADNLSWRVRVLPFLEEMALYDSFNMDEAWDSEQNKPLASRMPAIYGADGSNSDACWIKLDDHPRSFANITDGTSNTIMILQNPAGVPWTQPKDLTIDEAIKLVKGLDAGKKLVAGFYDGSVRMIDQSIDEQTLRNLLDPRDGNVVDLDF